MTSSRDDRSGEMVGQLICLRHAEAELPRWAAAGGSDGCDAPPERPLTARGHRQAEVVAQHLLARRPQHVFASAVLRARQTGAIIAAALGVPLVVVPDLAEVSLGRGEHQPTPPGLAAAVLRQWLIDRHLDVRLLDGETGHEVAQRMTRALATIVATSPVRRAIVVGHVASLTVGVAALCHNGPALWGQPLPYATPFDLTHTRAGWRVQWPAASLPGVDHEGADTVTMPGDH